VPLDSTLNVRARALRARRASGCQRDYDCGAAVNSVALHPNQAELICGLQNGNIRVWDLAENKCTEYVRTHNVARVHLLSCCLFADGS
jgi:G protein beta subunit-like protein